MSQPPSPSNAPSHDSGIIPLAGRPRARRTRRQPGAAARPRAAAGGTSHGKRGGGRDRREYRRRAEGEGREAGVICRRWSNWARAYRQMTEQLGKVIVGQQQVIEQVITAMFCQGHVLLVGVPGLAKTAAGQNDQRGADAEL